MKKKVKVRKPSKFSKLVHIVAIIMLVLTPFVVIGTKALISNINFEVEELKNKVSKQEKTNESLNMKINELASLENIQEVAKEYGLEYNNDNIKIVMK